MLLAVAGRAIPLFAVDAIERMAVFTMRFLGIDVGRRRGITHRALGWRYGLQVLRIDAVAMPAGMVDEIAGRNRTSRKPEGNAMGTSRCSAQKENPVAVAVQSARPHYAIADGRTGLLEAVAFGLCRWVVLGHRAPLARMVTGAA